MLPVPTLLGVLCAFVILTALWWFRERRQRRQREAVSAVYALSEDIIAAASPAEIAGKLAASLPRVIPSTAACLYLYNRATRCLERVPTAAYPEPAAAPIDQPPDGLVNAAVVCFRNRTPLSVPDVRRNPLIKLDAATAPQSAYFVPLLASHEALGVLEVDNGGRVGYYHAEDQAAVQHLANQVAAALRLQEQHAMREQLFRGEKLAATGQLISGVANELRAPLESIAQLATSLAEYIGQPVPEIDVRQLAAEAGRASEIVARLTSFAQQESAAPGTVDIAAVLAGLARFREPEWRALGLRVQNHVGPAGSKPAPVMGVAAQLEQVLLTLLVYAEQRAIRSPGRTVSVKAGPLGGRILAEIDYSASLAAENEPDPFSEGAGSEGGMGLGVCRGIVHNHGGEIRMRRRGNTCGFEVDLPASAPMGESRAAPSLRVAPLTLMLVDGDETAARQLILLLGDRGHRVIPAAAEEAADLAQRLRFEAVLWAVRAGHRSWAEYQDRIRQSVQAFVLISDGFDQQLANSLEQNGGFLLSRPVQEASLDRILQEIAGRVTA